MALYNVNIGSRVSFSTTVEAASEEEAKEKAMDEWRSCDISDMEFFDTNVCDVYEED